MTVALWLASLAVAADYRVADVLSAWRAGMPDEVVASIAGLVPAASAIEKSCVLAAGLPRPLVDALRGPAPAELAPEQAATDCAPIGLDVKTIDATARQQQQARADAGRRSAWEDALQARVACLEPTFRKDADPAAEIAGWMRRQVASGATGFVTVSRAVTIQGSGAETTILCSW